jgi:hypothetical protein
VRSAVEHVFAGQKHRMGIIVQRIASNDQAQHHLKVFPVSTNGTDLRL